jgi:hypothetical protein
MISTPPNSKPVHVSTIIYPRTLTIVLVALCVAIVYSVLALGVNTFHGCHGTQSPLGGQEETEVHIILRNHTSQDARHETVSKHTEAAATTAAAATAAVQLNHQPAKNKSMQALVTSHVSFQLPEALGLPSDAWRPHIYSECATGMPQGYAPCLNYSNLLHGEELVYPGKNCW